MNTTTSTVFMRKRRKILPFLVETKYEHKMSNIYHNEPNKNTYSYKPHSVLYSLGDVY